MEPMTELTAKPLMRREAPDIQTLAADWLAVGEELPFPRLGLLLTTEEVELLLCFALTTPLPFGPLEEGLCDKLRRHLCGIDRLRLGAAPNDH